MDNTEQVVSGEKKSINRKLFLLLVSLFMAIVGLIIAIVAVRLNSRIEILSSCVSDDEIIDASTCINDVKRRVDEICPEAEMDAKCYDKAWEFISAQINEMVESKEKNSLEAFRVSHDADYSQYETVIRDALSVDIQALSDDEKFVFYTNLNVAYSSLGDKKNAQLYDDLLTELMDKGDYQYIGG